MKKGLFLVVLVVAMLQSALVASAQTIFYVVQPGDTLFGISLFYGVSVESIANCNDIVNPALIDVGTELRIPQENWPCATGLDEPGPGQWAGAGASQSGGGAWTPTPGSGQASQPESGSWTNTDASGPWTPTPSPDDPPTATPEPDEGDDEDDEEAEAEEADADESDADESDEMEEDEDVQYEVYTTTVVVTTTQVVTATTEVILPDGSTQTIVLTTTIPVTDTVVLTLTEAVEAPAETETVEEEVEEVDADGEDAADTDEDDGADDADDEAAEEEAVSDEDDEEEADDEEADDEEVEAEPAAPPTFTPFPSPTPLPTATPLPTPWPTSEWRPTSVPTRQYIEHTITAGESLIYLSVIYDVPVSCITGPNNITDPDVLSIGQVLLIDPTCGQPTPTPAPPTPNWSATRAASGPTPDWSATNAAATVAAAPPAVAPTAEPTDEPAEEPAEEDADEDADEAADEDEGEEEAESEEGDALATPTLIPTTTLTIEPVATEEPTVEPTEEPDDSDDSDDSDEEAAAIPAPSGGTGSYGLGGITDSFNNVAKMKEIGMTWVKLENEWTPGSSADSLKGQIDRVHSEDMKVLVSVSGAPGLFDAEDYTDYLGAIAGLSPDAIEVWEGQNTDLAWSAGQINPAAYVSDVLQPAYEKIKEADSNVLVISGAPLPTSTFRGRCNVAGCDDVPYIEGMFEADAAQYADCIGVRFMEGLLSPWERQGDDRDNADHYTRYYPAMVESYRDVSNNRTPLCFTGLGYLTDEGLNPEIDDDSLYAWAENTSLLNQADWLGQAVQLSRMDPRVEMMILDNIDQAAWNITSGNELADNLDAGYAMVRRDGSCPACENIKAAMGQ